MALKPESLLKSSWVHFLGRTRTWCLWMIKKMFPRWGSNPLPPCLLEGHHTHFATLVTQWLGQTHTNTNKLLFVSTGWCIHQGVVPARRWVGQEESVSDRGYTHAACLSDPHDTLQASREQEEGHQRWVSCLVIFYYDLVLSFVSSRDNSKLTQNKFHSFLIYFDLIDFFNAFINYI